MDAMLPMLPSYFVSFFIHRISALQKSLKSGRQSVCWLIKSEFIVQTPVLIFPTKTKQIIHDFLSAEFSSSKSKSKKNFH